MTEAERLDYQHPHATEVDDSSLEVSIGGEVREFRKKLDMTVAELAKASGLSAGMLSKIENGMTSPSLATLRALSRAPARSRHGVLPGSTRRNWTPPTYGRDRVWPSSGEGPAPAINISFWATA